MSKLLQNSGIRLPQLMNTSGFHQNVGEGNKSLNAMSPDPLDLLSEAFGKGSGCARLDICSRSSLNLKLLCWSYSQRRQRANCFYLSSWSIAILSRSNWQTGTEGFKSVFTTCHSGRGFTYFSCYGFYIMKE